MNIFKTCALNLKYISKNPVRKPIYQMLLKNQNLSLGEARDENNKHIVTCMSN